VLRRVLAFGKAKIFIAFDEKDEHCPSVKKYD